MGILGVRHMYYHPIRGYSLEKRTEQWGKGIGTIYVIGNFTLLGIWIACGRKR